MRKELQPDLSPDQRREIFREGIELFNRGRFFESHEVWEEIWRSTTPEPRDLFQGLIQVAAAMHQFLNLERISGPIRTFARARRRLEPFTPVSHGLDVGALLAVVGEWQAWLERCEGEPPEVPVIRVIDSAAVR